MLKEHLLSLWVLMVGITAFQITTFLGTGQYFSSMKAGSGKKYLFARQDIAHLNTRAIITSSVFLAAPSLLVNHFPNNSGTVSRVRPVKVIFDTDIGSDNDDASAAAILHALADAGEVEILAMGVVKCWPYSAACLDAINTYYGRGDIPIGANKQCEELKQRNYAEAVAKRCPNDIGLMRQVPNVVQVYRRALASQADGSVTIIAVGTMDSLVHLLDSRPDQYSSLPGRELVRKKVDVAFVMAPYFSEGNEYQKTWNFGNSPAMAFEFVERWPTKISFAEGNLGHRHFVGGRLSEAPERNPVRVAFEEVSGGTARKRHCADPTTVLYAVYGTRYFNEVGPGACDIRRGDGYTRWNAAVDRGHFYGTQKLPVAELEAVMETLLMQPPKYGR